MNTSMEVLHKTSSIQVNIDNLHKKIRIHNFQIIVGYGILCLSLILTILMLYNLNDELNNTYN